MDIDKLEAGRITDTLVHEMLGQPELCKHEADHYGKCGKCGLNKAYWGRVIPPLFYSTDLSSAWQAFMQMKHPPKDDISVPPDTEFYRTVIEKDGEFSAGWLWQSLGRVAWYGKYLGNGKTAEIAICRAVLKAAK